MTPSEGQDRLPYSRLKALCSEHETTIDTLRRQINDVEAERDQALNGLGVITQGLRRRAVAIPTTQPASETSLRS